MSELRKWVGFDSSEREMGFAGKPQTRLSLALAASHKSLTRLARLKDAVRHAPPRAAVGSFPYPHRTCAEIDEQFR